MEKEKEVVLVTGATSGIGFDTARLLAERGYVVFGAGRHTEALKELEPLGVKAVKMDLTDEWSIKAGVQWVLEESGRIDVLVNNAGYGSLGALENVSPHEAKRQFEVNVFGLMNLTQQVLPRMRAQRHGRIVNVSSVAGRVVMLMGGWYHASKYAIEALSDALRREVKLFGIQVVIVEPGAIKTPWADIAAQHLADSSRGTAYEEAAKRASRQMERLYGGRWASAPMKVARKIVHAVSVRHPRARYAVGFGSTLPRLVKAILPAKAQDWLFRKI